MSEELTVTPTEPTELVAKHGKAYRYKHLIMVVVLIAYGAWSCYDGFVRYPRDNDEATSKGLSVAPHPGLDIPFNQYLGMFLPPLALVFLGWTFFNSRGEYRLKGNILSVPGHPSVPLTAIKVIDKAKWERKGIAFIDYQPEGNSGIKTIKLDDYIYEREPTDAILARIEAALVPQEQPLVAPKPPAPATPPRPSRQQVK